MDVIVTFSGLYRAHGDALPKHEDAVFKGAVRVEFPEADSSVLTVVSVEPAKIPAALDVAVIFAPMLQVPGEKKPVHEQTTFEGAQSIEFPEGRGTVLTVVNALGRYVKYDWMHVREVQVKVLPAGDYVKFNWANVREVEVEEYPGTRVLGKGVGH